MKVLCRLAAALGAAALLAGCGGGGEAEGDPRVALSDTAAKLGEIRSGKLDFRLVLDPEGEGERVGFELAGPFALGDETHGPSLPPRLHPATRRRGGHGHDDLDRGARVRDGRQRDL